MNKKTILIIGGFILAIILTAIITTIIVRNSEDNTSSKTNEVKKEDSTINNNKVTEQINNQSDEQATIKDESSSNSSNQINKEQTKDNITTNTTESIKVTKTEADVVAYVENIEKTNTGSTLKAGFVTVVDFLFYDGEIYGQTFSSISNSAKLKIISLALKIDAKIDEYFPGYKETISTTTNKAYTSIKSKLVTLYLDTTVKICSNNPALCEDAKAGLQELKTSFGLTWDFIKDISGVGLTKLKDWYEVWREE